MSVKSSAYFFCKLKSFHKFIFLKFSVHLKKGNFFCSWKHSNRQVNCSFTCFFLVSEVCNNFSVDNTCSNCNRKIFHLESCICQSHCRSAYSCTSCSSICLRNLNVDIND